MKQLIQKSIRVIVIAILILNLVLVSGCLDRSEESEIFHYEINVDSENNTSFELYLPVPIISRDKNPKEGKPTELVNELEVKSGQVDYHVNKTSKGYALIMNSSSSFEIVGHKELSGNTDVENDYVFGNLSMSSTDENDSSYWLYYNNSIENEVSIDLKAYWRSIPEDSETYEWELNDFRPNRGWQSVKFLE